jgi:hypothetical protein
LDREEWIGCKTLMGGTPCGIVAEDGVGAERPLFFTEAPSGGKSPAWMDGIGHGQGVDVFTYSNLQGTATGGNTTSVLDAGAAWPTGGDGLASVPVRVVHADGTVESGVIASNTGTALTLAFTLAAACAAGDTYSIGVIPAVYRSGRVHGGLPDRKKRFLEAWLWLKYGGSVGPLKLRVYADNAATPSAEISVSKDEDGVEYVAADPDVQAKPGTADVHRFRVRLPEIWAVDVQLELWSVDAALPWELMNLRLMWQVDDSGHPRER